MRTSLNPRQLAFIAAYVSDPKRNAAQAYRNAGYSCRGSTAEAAASRLLRHRKVAEEVANIEREQAHRAQLRLGLKLERLTMEVARGAFFDPRRLFHEDGSPKALHELDADTASAIAGVDVDEVWAGKGDERRVVGRTYKFKLVDRKAFVDMGLKVIGGYKEDNKQNNPGDSLAEFLKGMGRSAMPVVYDVPPDEGL